MRYTVLAIVSMFVVLGWPGPAQAQLQRTVYAQGFSQPVQMVQDPTDPSLQLVLEQNGLIKAVQNGSTVGVFLDLTGKTAASGERGLFSLAFAPDYASSRRFYVHYSRKSDGHTVIERYKRSAGSPFVADPSSAFPLRWPSGLTHLAQPYSNHNGGSILFGPDGYLYIALGDGGSGGDPENRAQDPGTLLGKILRIDVDVADGHPTGYVVPADNPFVDGTPIAAMHEIWAFGLRNPWRIAFDDPARGGTGAMFIGDVGQGAREEISYQPPGRGARNYGWRHFEGTLPFDQSEPAAYQPLIMPIHDYPRSYGTTVTGGQVYRGTALGPSFVGRYFFADFGTFRVKSLAIQVDPGTGEASVTGQTDHTSELGGIGISSIDVGADGELYLVSYPTGQIFKVVSSNPDSDGDGLPTSWETQFGLDPNSASGSNGAGGDPDGDGRTNLQEYQQSTHPRGTPVGYFAEGATSSFFDARFALLNAGGTDATVLLRFLRSTGSVVTRVVSVQAGARVTVDAKTVGGLATAEFSTVVESNVPVVADRIMSWDGSGYGSHAETSIAQPRLTWYLAEGSTVGSFDLFYLFQNPSLTSTASVQVTFLLPSGAKVSRSYSVAANSRFNVWVDLIPGLTSTDVSATVQVTNGVPILVERAMYLSTGGQQFAAGHESAAVPGTATSWFLAEGATGSFFDEFVLVANPNATAANIRATYLRPNGTTLSKDYVVGPTSRFNIWVDEEQFPGVGKALANTAVSVTITSLNGVGVVVERAMWWPGPTSATWREAHNSPGSTVTGRRWALAAGEDGGAAGHETYILIANTQASAGSVRVRLVFEDKSAPVEKTYALAASSRFNVAVRSEFPQARGKRFGAIVESLGGSPVQIVVERAMYSNAGGVVWAAGSNALATRLQ